ncbi:hypothetical protein CDSE_0059 [Candidatus Kinetoplastibacterium desouzaii TCC079E]|uniref:Uncharacterized protein n=1 Tax=Candidatus Kinetoplastidibacterium desouzai TCC079E TaxID=1208919 RepID=M1L350_9PROT|nr:hypothetical protein CDSE_0059 [Candidatus Kinetoplastibacterium desouzaii TCC079E]
MFYQEYNYCNIKYKIAYLCYISFKYDTILANMVSMNVLPTKYKKILS